MGFLLKDFRRYHPYSGYFTEKLLQLSQEAYAGVFDLCVIKSLNRALKIIISFNSLLPFYNEKHEKSSVYRIFSFSFGKYA